MALKLHNTLSRSLEEFVPLDPARKKVGMYCCGPTVYDYAHIGNWRTFVFGDLVRRYLGFKGFEVLHVMNITDVDDKIIHRVASEKTSLRSLTSRYESAFFEDLKHLNCLLPHHTPCATQHVPEIILLIETLMARNLAYTTDDGSVYFSLERYRAAGGEYGQLVTLNLEEMRPGERVQNDEYGKEGAGDFALWKARVPEDGQIFWTSPWGEGRPGWHIECSAMSMKLLGPSFDLHLGGEDLMFPHHEDEIAQSEGAGLQSSGQKFVKYWLHGAHLLVEGRKMSKTLGNYHTLRDLMERGFSGREVRCLLLSAHYRETFNFTMDGLHDARKSLARIDECLGKLRELAGGRPGTAETGLLEEFASALNNDLNVSAARAAIFGWVHETNRRLAAGKVDQTAAAAAIATWDRVDSVLGFGSVTELTIPAEITELLAARVAARHAKDFAKADEIRDQLRARGWLIEDTAKGAKVKRL